MSRVFAREAAQKVGQKACAGSPARSMPAAPTWRRCWRTIPHDAIRTAQAGLLADMDRVADVLYERAA